MSEILSKEETKLRKDEILNRIRHGAVFIHPTDTIYGLGCNALDNNAVKKIRDIKGRPKTPFSVMVHSKDWIRENCIVPKKSEAWIKKLPGPYTLIFKIKNKGAVGKETNPGMDTLGVRMPDHWIIRGAEMLDLPIITTSANKVGDDFMTSLEDLDSDIKSKLDFIIYEGEKKGNPSTIVDCTNDEPKVIKR
jgi:L-threonylcarbamoyladenylate synthase